MKLRLACLVGIAALHFSFSVRAETVAPGEKIKWEKWSDDIFERSKKEDRLVLLDLEAVWCHWCHVMDKITYSDPEVIRLVGRKFIAVKVDQDSRPDLSNRYEEYGWPATIIFDPAGKEIVKRSAYIPPKPMARLLQACIDDPTPGPSVRKEPDLNFAAGAALPEALRAELGELFLLRYDDKEKGWGFTHKYLDWESLEWSLVRAAGGDARAERMARETLAAHQALIDPAWGGVYQYSTGGKWDEPHFEKIMPFQAESLRIYALAYAQFGDELYLKSAQRIQKYLRDFLSGPEGAFYASQDADLVKGEHSEEYFKLDDDARRKLGLPKVDTHLYSRENGAAIRALAILYGAAGDADALAAATRAAEWILKNRGLPGGGFRHDETDSAGPYLGDTLSMGQAFLALYAVTGERRWLARAEEAAQFIEANFVARASPPVGEVGPASVPAGSDAGYLTTKAPPAGGLLPRPQREENAYLARFANLLAHYTGKKSYRQTAERAFRFLTAPEVARRFPSATPLLCEYELARDPLHMTVVGRKDDPKAEALFRAAAKYPSSYKRVEWLDRREGALPNPDADYPDLPEAAAFVCTEGRCSAPLRNPGDLRAKVDKLRGP